MKTSRRRFLQASLTAASLRAPRARAQTAGSTYDVAVIGAGVFGAWTAWYLTKQGKRVALVDAHGPGNSRSSSGGETRVTRMGYGKDELYTRWSLRSLGEWKALAARTGGAPLFHATGVLWMAREQDPLTLATQETLARVAVPHQKLDRRELEARWPQIDFGPVRWAIHEPESGALMARRSVQAVVSEAVASGVDLVRGKVEPPKLSGRLAAIRLGSGASLSAGSFVFACGPWLPKVFPEVLDGRIFPTRQEVFYFGPPPGEARFAPPAMPTWIDFGDEIYGIPDIESKGMKIAPDKHGPAFDPDSGERVVTREGLRAVRAFVARRFPALKGAPLVASEVCQYENTSNGDFLIDRHPESDDVWMVGGGSGHGFKHGPAVGSAVAQAILGGAKPDPRFNLATKARVQKRSVY